MNIFVENENGERLALLGSVCDPLFDPTTFIPRVGDDLSFKADNSSYLVGKVLAVLIQYSVYDNSGPKHITLRVKACIDPSTI
jgi:hypothetical protein